MNDYSSYSVMVVDDTETNIDILVETLGEIFDLRVAMDGKTALEDIAEDPPDLILLDIMMPDMDGYEVCEKLKLAEATRDIPVIFLTAMTDEQNEAKGLALGAVDYITKPFSPDLVKARIQNQLELKKHRDHLEELVRERTREVVHTQDVTIFGMATLAEYRDPETGGHIMRTQRYVHALAEHLKDNPKFAGYFQDKTIELLFKSTPLHDIGKVGVEDSILLKPGRLTKEEFEEMKRHTIYGGDAITKSEKAFGNEGKITFLHFAKEIAYSHQEKWDGTGYPHGLKGENIPISARLMSIADVYDALISKRVYKPPFPHKKAVKILLEGDGRTEPQHFDPDMLQAFDRIQEQFLQIALEFADYEEEKQALLSEE